MRVELSLRSLRHGEEVGLLQLERADEFIGLLGARHG